ncbi:MAG: amidohydrolase [Sulfobacillus thermosulfidooxidans]|uniref:Amidohydrolase n=1 Tax=Sulfobacillus thermosulfidooxidans TaxID=28034 RepID=A0A2T2X120_SULTH|nr:MAG: amidohydrolase [Sulfobacillus thermosulfidooxidans]
MWALTHVRIMDGTGLDIEDGGMLIDNGRIVDVSAHLQVPLHAEEVSGQGRLCLPGFIDAHSHIGLSTSGETLGNQDVNEATEAITADVRALDGINPQDPAIKEALAQGVTTAFVTMGSANVISGMGSVVHLWGETVEDMVIAPAAGMKAAMGENPIRVHGNLKHRPSSRPGVAAILREWLERARLYAQQSHIGYKDYDPRFEALAAVVRRDIPLRVHAHRADDILTAIRIGREFRINLVIVHGTEADLVIDQIKAAGVFVVTGPSFSARTKQELRHKGFHTPAALVKAKIVTAVASDHPVVPAEYLRLYAGLTMRHGLSFTEALSTITTAPAKILGMDDQLGQLKAGYRADFVLWKGNPLTDIQAEATAVYIAGRHVL